MVVDATSLQGARYLALTTFRRDGTPVPTPMYFVEDGEELLLRTAACSGKVKRIRNRAEVTVAACDGRGGVLGEPFPARARILGPGEGARVERLLRRKYGVQLASLEVVSWLARVLSGRRRGAPAYLALRPEGR